MIDVICSNVVLLVYLTHLMAVGWLFWLSGVKEMLATALPLCFTEVEVYLWSLVSREADTFAVVCPM